MKIASAQWRHLLYLNYRLDPALVRPLLPPGLDVDTYDGAAWLSWVGKLVEKVRVLGIHLPDHSHYAHLSAQVYVRRKNRAGIWRLKSWVPQPLTQKVFAKEDIAICPTEFSMHFEEGGRDEVLNKPYSNAVLRYAADGVVLHAKTSGLPQPVSFEPDDPFFFEKKEILGPGRSWNLEFPPFFLWPAELVEARLPRLQIPLPAAPESVRVGKGFHVIWRT